MACNCLEEITQSILENKDMYKDKFFKIKNGEIISAECFESALIISRKERRGSKRVHV